MRNTDCPSKTSLCSTQDLLCKSKKHIKKSFLWAPQPISREKERKNKGQNKKEGKDIFREMVFEIDIIRIFVRRIMCTTHFFQHHTTPKNPVR